MPKSSIQPCTIVFTAHTSSLCKIAVRRGDAHIGTHEMLIPPASQSGSFGSEFLLVQSLSSEHLVSRYPFCAREWRWWSYAVDTPKITLHSHRRSHSISTPENFLPLSHHKIVESRAGHTIAQGREECRLLIPLILLFLSIGPIKPCGRLDRVELNEPVISHTTR